MLLWFLQEWGTKNIPQKNPKENARGTVSGREKWADRRNQVSNNTKLRIFQSKLHGVFHVILSFLCVAGVGCVTRPALIKTATMCCLLTLTSPGYRTVSTEARKNNSISKRQREGVSDQMSVQRKNKGQWTGRGREKHCRWATRAQYVTGWQTPSRQSHTEIWEVKS